MRHRHTNDAHLDAGFSLDIVAIKPMRPASFDYEMATTN